MTNEQTNEEKERDGGFVNREYYKKPQVNSGEFVCKKQEICLLLKSMEMEHRAEVTIMKNMVDRKDADLWNEKMRREHLELELKSKQEEKKQPSPVLCRRSCLRHPDIRSGACNRRGTMIQINYTTKTL